jgi:hypothetical protein
MDDHLSHRWQRGWLDRVVASPRMRSRPRSTFFCHRCDTKLCVRCLGWLCGDRVPGSLCPARANHRVPGSLRPPSCDPGRAVHFSVTGATRNCASGALVGCVATGCQVRCAQPAPTTGCQVRCVRPHAIQAAQYIFLSQVRHEIVRPVPWLVVWRQGARFVVPSPRQPQGARFVAAALMRSRPRSTFFCHRCDTKLCVRCLGWLCGDRVPGSLCPARANDRVPGSLRPPSCDPGRAVHFSVTGATRNCASGALVGCVATGCQVRCGQPAPTTGCQVHCVRPHAIQAAQYIFLSQVRHEIVRPVPWLVVWRQGARFVVVPLSRRVTGSQWGGGGAFRNRVPGSAFSDAEGEVGLWEAGTPLKGTRASHPSPQLRGHPLSLYPPPTPDVSRRESGMGRGEPIGRPGLFLTPGVVPRSLRRSPGDHQRPRDAPNISRRRGFFGRRRRGCASVGGGARGCSLHGSGVDDEAAGLVMSQQPTPAARVRPPVTPQVQPFVPGLKRHLQRHERGKSPEAWTVPLSVAGVTRRAPVDDGDVGPGRWGRGGREA